VSNTSQEPIYTITLDELEPLKPEDITVTWDMNSLPSLTTSDIITLTGTPYNSGSYTIGNIETVDLSGIDSFTTFSNFYKDEFDGRFPDYERVQEMCKEYPGLEIAYRKFKEVYKMVKEDFDGKERERKGYK
jgi:hypothetical protein